MDEIKSLSMINEVKVDPRAHRRAIEYKYRQSVLQNKKYYCVNCDIAYRDIIQLNNHYAGMKHNIDRYIKYDCGKCGFYTKNKYDFNKHLTSKKHNSC